MLIYNLAGISDGDYIINFTSLTIEDSIIIAELKVLNSFGKRLKS